MLAVHISLQDMLPVIGLAQLGDGRVEMQEIHDYRSFYLLRRRLAANTAPLTVLQPKSRYLAAALADIVSPQTTFLPHDTLLTNVPSDWHYVIESYPAASISALRLLLTVRKLACCEIFFQSVIDTVYTSVTINTLKCIGVLPSSEGESALFSEFNAQTTPMGRRRFAGPIMLHPCVSVDHIVDRHASAPIDNRELAFQLGHCLRKLPDFDRVCMRLYSAVRLPAARLGEVLPLILHVYTALHALLELVEAIRPNENSKLIKKILQAAQNTVRLHNLLDSLFDLSAISHGAVSMILKSTAEHAELKRLYAVAAAVRANGQTHFSTVEELVGKGKLRYAESLRNERVFRCPRSVRLPEEMQIVRLNKNETLFTSAQLQATNKAEEDALAAIAELEREVIAKTFTLLGAFLPQLELLSDLIGTLDTLYSWNDVLRVLPHFESLWTLPVFNNDGRFYIHNGRHPVLTLAAERRMHARECVPNDCQLDAQKRNMLITGANMGGKSTYSRQQLAIALIAQYGMRIPADADSELCVFGVFWTRIGGHDNPCRGVSTFMVEVAETAGLLHAVDMNFRCLFIIDELGRGTSVEDGLRFARGVLRHLCNLTNVYSICATHFHELAYEMSSKLELKRMGNPTEPNTQFKLFDGIEAESNALNLARSIGFPEAIIVQAEQTLLHSVPLNKA